MVTEKYLWQGADIVMVMTAMCNLWTTNALVWLMGDVCSGMVMSAMAELRLINELREKRGEFTSSNRSCRVPEPVVLQAQGKTNVG